MDSKAIMPNLPSQADVMRAAKIFDMSRVDDLWRSSFTPPERLTPIEFAKKYVKIGHQRTPFNVDTHPWVIEPMNMLADMRIEQQFLIAAVQMGKNRMAEAYVAYRVAQDPCDITWYAPNIKLAHEFAEERLWPLVKNCEPVRKFIPLKANGEIDTTKVRKDAVLFTNCKAECLACNEANTQGRTRECLIIDEGWRLDKGRIAAAIDRTAAKELDGRRKTVGISTAGDEDSDLEAFWQKARKFLWHVTCPNPHCSASHPIIFKREMSTRVPKHMSAFTIEWTDDATTRPNGEWNIRAVKKTSRMRCPSCTEEHLQSPELIAHLYATGHYEELVDPEASDIKVCFWVPSMANGDFAMLIEKFIEADREAHLGLVQNMREFVIKNLAEAWSAGITAGEDVHWTADYDMLKPFEWPEEYRRYMHVDFQETDNSGGRYWYMCQAFSKDGASRIVEFGPLLSLEEVEHKAQLLGFVGDKTKYVCCDGNWNTTIVQGICARNRWICLRGRGEKEVFPWNKPGGTKTMPDGKVVQLPASTVWKFFSRMEKLGPGYGQNHLPGRVVQFYFSNTSIKNVLYALMHPKEPERALYYGIGKNIDERFFEHINAEVYATVMERGKKKQRWIPRNSKVQNHGLDNAVGCLCMAMMEGLIPMTTTTTTRMESDRPQI